MGEQAIKNISERQSTATAIEDDVFTTATSTAVATKAEDSYVDYTPPEAAKILPPAKYKLFLLILVLVYFAVWVTEEAGFYEFLRFRGWISPDFALFLLLGIVVYVLAYATLDLVVSICTFQRRVRDDNGNEKVIVFGLGPWLKAPRATWIYRYCNVFAETIAAIIQILEEGFAMFDAPNIPERTSYESHIPKQFHSPNGDCQKVLKIEHRINPDKIEEYNQWVERINDAAKTLAPGLLKTQNSFFTPTGTDEFKEGKEKDDIESGGGGDNGDGSSIGEKIPASSSAGTSSLQDGLLQTVLLTFKDVHGMNEWMMSPRRKVLMDELQPLLVVPDVVQIRLDRELPDAFTDLFTRQGESVPTLPPKKWKVWWLTTIALYISIKWADHFMAYYYDMWGINERHVRVQSIVANIVVVFVNSYILVPLLLFVFDYWMKRKELEPNLKEPWRTLNDGFQSNWSKAFLTFALYGGCIIAWIVKTYT